MISELSLSFFQTFCSVIPCLNNCTVIAIPDVLCPTIEHGRVSGSGLKDLQMPEFHFSSVISSLKGDDLHSKAELESFCCLIRAGWAEIDSGFSSGYCGQFVKLVGMDP